MTTTKHILDPAILPALRPALPALTLAALGHTLAGAAALAATWGVIKMIGSPDPTLLAWACAALVLGGFLSSAASWLAHDAEARVERRLRRDVAGHVLRLPASRATAWPSDRLRRLVSDDIAALHHTIAHLPGEIATLAVIPLCSVALLLALAGPLALTALIPGVLAALVYLLVLPRLSAAHGAERGLVMGEITTAVDDYARGIHVFRSFGAAEGALADYTDATGRFTSGMVAWVRRVATPAAIAVALLQAVASLAIAYAVGSAADPATLAATLLLSLAIVTPALRLGHGLDYVTAGRAAATRIGALLEEPTLPSGDARVSDQPLSVDVRELDLEFGGRRIVDGLSWSARPRTLTAITGPSGAGKSSLFRVIAGAEPVRSGSVTIGGVPIAELSEDGRTAAVLFVPQAPAPLPGTVADNLRLVNPDADDARCQRALDRAHLETSLHADATRLSGGERQRLALARAFLSPARVILADEPTSGLDTAIAGAVFDEFARLAHEEGRTVIIVTHDTGLANRADQRLHLEAARVATHDQEGVR